MVARIIPFDQMPEQKPDMEGPYSSEEVLQRLPLFHAQPEINRAMREYTQIPMQEHRESGPEAIAWRERWSSRQEGRQLPEVDPAWQAIVAEWEQTVPLEDREVMAKMGGLPVYQESLRSPMARLYDDMSTAPEPRAVVREVGFDGDDDVRIPQEMGPAPGWIERIAGGERAQAQEEALTWREQWQERHGVERLPQRLQQLRQRTTETPAQEQRHGQGYGR